ncbi:MAG: (Fe-S)-binding protein [Actinobacteria bacterium]|nr:(Fe-S)-binding protein [Actinomycetota bacterium]
MTPVSAAAVSTRPVLWHFTPALEALWYVLVVCSVAVCAFGFARPLLKYRHATWSRPWPEMPRRVYAAARSIGSQATVRARHPFIGAAHAGVFYGFLVLLAGTTILLIAHDIARPLGLDFFNGAFYLGYSLTLDLLGAVFIVGLLMFMSRDGLGTADRVFLWTLLTLAVGGFVEEGLRIAMEEPGYNWASPIGWLVSLPLALLPIGTLADLRHGVWWAHGLEALVFVALIPYTRASHMVHSFASMVLRDDRAEQRLQTIPPSRADAETGYGSFADFELKHLIDLDACTECGRCDDVCPARAVEMPLSPRSLVTDLRDQANGEQHPAAVFSRSTDRETEIAWEGGVAQAALWSCTQCNACVEVCPVSIEQAPIINQLRRRLVEEGELEPSLQSTLEAINKSGNSFSENRRKRGRWTRDLPFEVVDARAASVDVLWFVGDHASFDPRIRRVTCDLARIYEAAGVDFGILYEGERNAGNDVRRVGEEGLFESLAEANIAVLEECDFKRIVTSDPHSLNTLRNEYGDFGGSYEVIHHTSLLLELIEEGRLGEPRRLGRTVTYHDPCFLGRINGGFDAPRQLLAAAGCELREMPLNRENSFCCGAGGGRIWMSEDYGMAERPSESRIREALELGDLDHFVVSCPKDVTMYEDAIKTTGSTEQISLREVTEILVEAFAPVLTEVG